RSRSRVRARPRRRRVARAGGVLRARGRGEPAAQRAPMSDNRGVLDADGTEGKIVVGVDGSDPSRKAVHWALREAAIRGAKLVAVHAWSYYPSLPPDSLDPMLMTPNCNEAPVR